MDEIHNRPPVILEPREYAEWLEESERPPVHLLRILPDEDMTIEKVDVESPAGKFPTSITGARRLISKSPEPTCSASENASTNDGDPDQNNKSDPVLDKGYVATPRVEVAVRQVGRA
jgi:hypothetical protein